MTDGSTLYIIHILINSSCFISQALCSRPKTPLNARNWLPEQTFYDIGTSITLICKPGFKPESKPTVTCNNSRTSFGHLPSCKGKSLNLILIFILSLIGFILVGLGRNHNAQINLYNNLKLI